MLPRKNKKNSKKGKDLPPNSKKRSSLNVNASEFVPSVAQKQEYENAASSSVDQTQYFNCGGGGDTTNFDNAATAQRQEYGRSILLPADQLQNFNIGSSESMDYTEPEQRQEYTQSAFSTASQLQSLNISGFESSVNSAARSQGLEYQRPAYSLMDHSMQNFIGDGETDAHLAYSFEGQNFNITRRDFNDDAASSQRQEYSHPVYPSVVNMHFYMGGCETNAEDVACSQRPIYVHSLVNQMQNFNISPYEANDGGVSLQSEDNTHSANYTLGGCETHENPMFHRLEDIPMPCSDAYDDSASLQSQDYTHSPYATNYNLGGGETHENPIFQRVEDIPMPCEEAYDTNFSPGNSYSTGIDLNTNIATSTTASCLQEDNNLIDNTILSPDLKKMAVEASLTPENEINKETMDFIATPENNNNAVNINNSENITIQPAATPADNNVMGGEAPQMGNQKSSKKKNRARIDEVCSEKEHLNIVFIGHVDAGKSTIGGQVMFLTGMVDQRTMDKYAKEAKEKSRDSWYISWALDTNQEERDKGKTVETGRGHFETETKHFTILDAPGHKSFVPNMISGAAQADVAALVISARQNEFESGFDKGGQTRDHVMLAKSAGINILIALVNKMDDSTVKWDEKRYNYCRDKVMPFLKKVGYAAKDVYFMPVSGQTGHGLVAPVPKNICPWFNGPSFLDYLNNLPPMTRLYESPFVMPIVGKYKDMGTVVMGKIEAGYAHISNHFLLMPNKVPVSVEQIWSDDREVTSVKAGENVKLRLKGIEEDEISPGFVLCDIKKPITTATIFDAQLHILDCRFLITRGYSAILHTQSVAEAVSVELVLCILEEKNNVKTRKIRHFVKKDESAIMRLKCSGVICLTVFKEFAALGRFTLREDNKVVAIGVVLKIIM